MKWTWTWMTKLPIYPIVRSYLLDCWRRMMKKFGAAETVRQPWILHDMSTNICSILCWISRWLNKSIKCQPQKLVFLAVNWEWYLISLEEDADASPCWCGGVVARSQMYEMLQSAGIRHYQSGLMHLVAGSSGTHNVIYTNVFDFPKTFKVAHSFYYNL